MRAFPSHVRPGPPDICPLPETCYTQPMRYVIIIAAIAFFLAWDLIYNQARYIDDGVRLIGQMVRFVTG